MTFFSFPSTVKPNYEGDVIDLKILVQLGAFNMLLCDQHCDIADMKIRGQIYIMLYQVIKVCRSLIFFLVVGFCGDSL